MRILFVGGIQEKKSAAAYYDVAPKLINGFTRNGHNVIHFADRDIARMSNFMRSRKMGIKPCNARLLKVIATYAPHLIIFKHADVILPETAAEIKHTYPHIKLAQVNVDALFNPDNVNRIRSKAAYMDANFITTAGSAMNKVKAGDAPVYFMPNPVDASHESERAFEKNDKTMFDLFFAYGSAPDGDPRQMIPRGIQNGIPELKFNLRVCSENGGLWGAEYTKQLGMSKCGLNLSRKQERDRHAKDEDLFMYSSDRVAHYVGNGLLTYSDEAFELQHLFNEKEMVFYSTQEDLHDKLRYYMQHDDKRQKMAEAGWKRAHENYNERIVAKFIEEATFGELKSTFNWPQERV